MEREVWYHGVKLAVMEWQGARELDLLHAARAVRRAFKDFPEPMPAQPRLLWVARILSAYVRRPLADQLAAQAGQRGPFDPIAYTRDSKLEEQIVAEAIRHYGLARIGRWFEEEKARAAIAAAQQDARLAEEKRLEGGGG